MPVIGWTNVGKTMWLYSLVRTLDFLTGPKGWKNSEFSGVDAYSRDLIIEAKKYEGKKGPLDGTAVLPGTPFLFLLKDMPRWGSRTLVFQDLAGEPWHNQWFDKNKDTKEAALYRQQLVDNKSVMMLFSIQDMLESTGDGHSMNSLIETYRQVLRDAGSHIEAEKRRILVVLTKSAKIKRLAPNLLEYLQADPIARKRNETESDTTPVDIAGMADYAGRMKAVSDQLKEWVTAEAPGGNRFLTTAKNLNVTVDFCLTSSLTQTIERRNQQSPNSARRELSGTIRDIWHCKRVLDPLFWALEMHNGRGHRR